MHPDLLRIFKSIQSQPTAPFHEQLVRDEILRYLKTFPHVSVETDSFGNLIARYQRGSAAPRLAFAAHMDHPAYVKDPETGELTFLGGVPEEYRAKNPPTRDFGEFAMWDLPEFEVSEDRITSRVCDDLIGCAAIVSLFQELERKEVEATCYGLFTRAEEVGFVGAIELARNWPLPEGVRFVSLETSAPVPGTEMGSGPVIRVGDRLSVFDHEVTADLVETAKTHEIQVQRALLDRGSCEATAVQHFGVPAAGISILLGNYHNCGPDLTIAAEFVQLPDVTGMVDLIYNLVKDAGSESPGRAALGERFEKRVRDHARFAEATRAMFTDS